MVGIFTCFEHRVTVNMKNAAASAGAYPKAPVIASLSVWAFWA